jgi:hypothetical protein
MSEKMPGRDKPPLNGLRNPAAGPSYDGPL